MSNPITALDLLGVSERQVIQSVIAEAFFADYGIVRAVNGNVTVDVEHAIRAVTRAGIQATSQVLDPTISKEVELLFPMMGGLSIEGTVNVGDGVLLIGLRGLLSSTVGITESKAPAEFWHYSQQTLKAIPLAGISTASVQFGESTGKAFLRNSSASLYTIMSDLYSALNTFATTSSSATTAPQIAAAAATLVTALAPINASINALLEA